MHDVFAFGYTGREFATLVEGIQRSDAILVDIRFSPRSRVPTWNRGAFEKALGYSYVWAGDILGNRLYRTDKIEIVDLEDGIRLIEGLAQDHPVALMCVCKDARGCHREVITSALRERGITVAEGVPTTAVTAVNVLNRLVGEAVLLQAWLWNKQGQIEIAIGHDVDDIGDRIAEIAVNASIFSDVEYRKFMAERTSWASDEDVEHVTGLLPAPSVSSEPPMD